MPNAIKYSTTGDTLSLKKGNIFFGVGDVGKGPSSATTYYNGVTPSVSGYTIYLYNASQTSNLSFYSVNDDTALITYTNQVSGQNFSTATQCLNWYATQSNYVCVNRDYESIVTSGLTFCVDAGFRPSYTSSGTTWYDLSYGGNSGTLTNGPSFVSANGGSIDLDGTNDYVNIPNPSTIMSKTSYTKTAWFNIDIATYNIISGGDSATHAFWMNGTTKLNAGHNGNWTTVQSTTNLTTGIWYHGAVTFDTTNGWKLYLNGVLESTSSSTTTFNGANDILFIGAYNAAQNLFNGKVAIANIYNRVLSQTEIQQNFNSQKSRFGL